MRMDLGGAGGRGLRRISTFGPPPGAVDPVDRSRSLIPSDAAVLSDQEIDRILTARVEVPDRMRVAVLYLSHSRSRDWWQQNDLSEDSFRSALSPVLKLLEDERVSDVSFLPSFLLPAQKSIPLIREAAARYQADWVLIVKTEARVQEGPRPRQGRSARQLRGRVRRPRCPDGHDPVYLGCPGRCHR
ncbi:MAG: hypothetical protein IPM94_16140 [bacterium]|nr:hypothetical protein [bacterium]